MKRSGFSRSSGNPWGGLGVLAEAVDLAGGDDLLGHPHAHRLDQEGELVEEEVGGHAARVVPVAAVLEVPGRVPVAFGGEAVLVAEPLVPVEVGAGPGVDVVLSVVAPLAGGVVAGQAGLGEDQLADPVLLDVFADLVGDAEAGPLDADLQFLAGFLDDPDQVLGLVDRVAHRLLAVHGLAGLEGLGGDFVMPVVGGGDDDDVDVLVVQDLAIVAGAFGLAAALGDRLQAPIEPLGVDLGDPGDLDVVGPVLRPLDQRAH